LSESNHRKAALCRRITSSAARNSLLYLIVASQATEAADEERSESVFPHSAGLWYGPWLTFLLPFVNIRMCIGMTPQTQEIAPRK
jgi:hypothetical protein